MSEVVERPPRPMLPPLFWALLTTLCCVRAVLWAGPDPRAPLLAACLVTVLGVLVVALLRWRACEGVLVVTLPVIAALVCSLLVCSWELSRQESLSSSLSSSSTLSWEFLLEGDMSEGASGWRGRASALRDGARVGSVWLVSSERHLVGTTLRCVGRFSPNGDDKWGASTRSQGLAGTVRVIRVLESRPATGIRGAILDYRERVLARLDPSSSDARALLAGTICGFTPAMSERGLSEVFAACGVSHLVAVSGGHLVLVTALAGALLSRTRLPWAPRAMTLLALTGAFVVFCGAPASAVRSWAMSLVAELSRLASRRAHPLSSVSAVALVMALLSPGVTGQLGYLLSVTCVCGICVLGSYARYVLRVCSPNVLGGRRGVLAAPLGRAGQGAGEALSLTLVSQVVTSPLTCSAFSQLSLVAPLANVVLAPLFSALLALGLGVAALQWAPSAQSLALLGCDAVGGMIVGALRALARLPLACIAVSVDEGPALVALAAFLVLLLLWWPRVSRGALLVGLGLAAALALLVVLRWRYFAPPCVRVLDVGQGDAILITDGASSVLVDTGPGDTVVEALARNHVLHLDAIVLTHLHADHAGGLSDVLGVTDVGMVIVPEGTDVTGFDVECPVAEICYRDVLGVGRFSLRAVSPVEPMGGEGNEGSLELALSFDDGTRTLTGLLAADAEREETLAVLERGDVGDVDVLKVGHHGSKVSLTPEIIEVLRPEVSVASAGEGNSYGHPDPTCVEMLEEAGSTFLCTKDVGDVTVKPGSEGPVVCVG